ncbi:ABC transporter ATP-binding protein [Phaeovulum vinaykumarii]|uniref:Iron complex transport system ATP-binding protein n=1 Tax=Phaeovulum vinaykumarii TaxID=407234 RepID=A0A1N7L8T4_9RHOB|nr:ABC transporter ATP-binding protein [Phaeovulum vinaykumarii]SIS70236.1 iron complex transport system ATP-binding protein [Phaeovulum vinaykumarii]SOB99031.1 iron complex transport system ATP-binding protein [Phaeovulum vinaykumarii]
MSRAAPHPQGLAQGLAQRQPGLHFEALTLKRAGRAVLENVSFDLRAGECLGLIGPNGAGKSTLMRAAMGLLPTAGHSDLARLPVGARARHAAFLPQGREIAWPVAVAHLVELGARAAGRGPDRAAAALARLDLAALAARPATALSGGEQARVLLARALAQDAPYLLADEPIAGLDPAQQIRTMRLLSDLATEGRGVMVSIHDIGLAARHCDRLLVIAAGRIVAEGPPRAVLTADLLARVFRIEARISETPEGLDIRPTRAL